MHDSNTDRLSKNALMEIYQAAVLSVNGHHAVAERLRQTPLEGDVSMVAVGKAAQSMAEGAREILGEQIIQGLVISKQGHLDFARLSKTGWRMIEGGHPLPNSGSLAAGDLLIEFLSDKNLSSLLFLISGGASSLVECPVQGVDQDFLVKASDWLLGSGLAINEINLVRKGLSRIKGGGLLRWIGDRPVRALAISDVPGDAPGIIGSGLLVPEPTLAMELHSLVLPEWLSIPLKHGIEERESEQRVGPEGHGKKDLSYLTPHFGQSFDDFQSQIPQISPATPHMEVPVSREAGCRQRLLADFLNQIAQISPKYERDLRTNHFFRSPEIEIVANLELAKQTAADTARAMGYQVRIGPEFIQGDAAENGRRLAELLLQGGSGVSIWGGETTVKLPNNPGRGGRNQHLALAAAQVLSGREKVWLLSVGTDGTDGPTEDAGALVDGDTASRAQLEGFDIERILQTADAGSLLEATGDLISSGPTGTNVMDLMIGLKL